MAETVDAATFARLVQKLEPQSRLCRAWQLTGGVSAQMTALELERPDGSRTRIVVRRHGNWAFEHHPNVAADEFRLLQALHAAGLPVPKPLYLDQAAEIFSRPSVVVEYIEGEPVLAAADGVGLMRRFATQLTRIHSLDCSRLALSFLGEQEVMVAERLGEELLRADPALEQGHVRAVLEMAWPLSQQNRSVLLHGDFWPGNLLWREGEIAGAIDWEDARIGDPLADLGNSRLEMLWAFGIEAMREFTQQYQAIRRIDDRDLPYWDLCAALSSASTMARWGHDESAVAAMVEQQRWFVRQALKALATRSKT